MERELPPKKILLNFFFQISSLDTNDTILGEDGGSEMTPKNWTLESKNRTLGGIGGQKSSDIINGRSLRS